MGNLMGWIQDYFKVRDASNVVRKIFDKDGYLYQRDTKITASGAELNKSTLLASADRVVKIAKVALAALDAAGGVLAWQNPESSAIFIDKIIVDVTTVSTGACTMDFGTTAVSAATSSDNLIDGLDTNAAVITADNITDKGTNGKSRQKLAAGKWVTGSKASGAAAGTVGFAYIHYTVI